MKPHHRSLTAGLVLVAFSVSCVTTRLPPISAAGATFQPLPDELELWTEARAEQDQLRAEAPLYDDPEVVEYLDEVVARLNPPGMAANRVMHYRVTVVEDPTLNAFAYPDGAIYIHTGLLARLENADQLATVLGHEMTHVEHRHMLRHRRAAHNREVGFTIVAVAAAVALAVAEVDALSEGHWGRAGAIDFFGELIVGLGLELAVLAAVNGYGRELELEADRGGFLKLRAAGYDVRESPRVYELLADDHGEATGAENFFFGSHPKLADRRANAVAEVARAPQDPAPQAGDQEAFARRFATVVRDDARLNLEIGRFQLAEDELERARITLPEDPEIHYLVGRLKLARAVDEPDAAVVAELRAAAEEALRTAIRLDATRPAPHRELGGLYAATGRRSEACAELGTYLRLLPDAEDAAAVQSRLTELSAEGRCEG